MDRVAIHKSDSSCFQVYCGKSSPAQKELSKSLNLSCKRKKKKTFLQEYVTYVKKNLTVDLTVLHKIFTNHGRLKGVFMHFHILLGLKQQFSARTTEKKTRFTLLILITFFHYPSCFLQACVLLLQNVMK